VNSASAITRGFINATKSGSRAAKLGREANQRGDKVVAVIFIVDSSAEVSLSESRLPCIRRGCYRFSVTKPEAAKGVSKSRQIPTNFSKAAESTARSIRQCRHGEAPRAVVAAFAFGDYGVRVEHVFTGH
jgi:hypothetical protein